MDKNGYVILLENVRIAIFICLINLNKSVIQFSLIIWICLNVGRYNGEALLKKAGANVLTDEAAAAARMYESILHDLRDISISVRIFLFGSEIVW